MSEKPRSPVPGVGLCSVCIAGHAQPTARGTTFWRCLRAEQDPGFRKYPSLPVRACPGFEPAGGIPEPSA